jgi:hypothetical protein
MSRVIVHDDEDVRSASSLVDLDGVQALVTLCASEEGVGAEIRFRSGPDEEFSDPIQLGDH